MYLNPYGEDPVNLAVILANDPPETVAELYQACDLAGLVIDRPILEADRVEIRAFLAEWAGVVDAGDRPTRAETLNRLLAAYAGHPRLTDHAEGWHLHYRDDGVSFARMVGAVISVGTALHLTTRGMDRLARCAAVDCVRIFADTSRNGRQRYCSTRCNNRAAVRRHRAGLGVR